MKPRNFLIPSLILLILLLTISGCAEPNQAQGTEGASGVAGFWAGLWHGFILPVAFVISLFDEGIGIYEIHNNGNMYNLGFVIGTWIVFGSVLASRRSVR
ncbi:MAG: hypothetical protein IBX61_08560 [Thermoleophilia bacterium]|nr:hypothetical protein [Thermoleophilia bacterium]